MLYLPVAGAATETDPFDLLKIDELGEDLVDRGSGGLKFHGKLLGCDFVPVREIFEGSNQCGRQQLFHSFPGKHYHGPSRLNRSYPLLTKSSKLVK